MFIKKGSVVFNYKLSADSGQLSEKKLKTEN